MSRQANPHLPFFQKIPLFEDLNDEELNDILQDVQVVTLNTGETLFSEGEESDAAYVIEMGELEVLSSLPQGGMVSVARLHPGEVLGELALIDGEPRSATVRALELTQLLRLDREAFEFLRRNFQPAAYKVIRSIALTLCDRIRETNDRLAPLLVPVVPHDEATSGAEETQLSSEKPKRNLFMRLLMFGKS